MNDFDVPNFDLEAKQEYEADNVPFSASNGYIKEDFFAD